MKSVFLILLPVLVLISCTEPISKTGIEFDFTADERLFTAHSFMNMAGHDWDYREEGMHPIRTEIRAILSERLSASYIDSISTYYRNHKHYLGDYGTYAFALSPAPEFELHFDSASSDYWAASDIKGLSGLDRQLREFYQKADIEGLWAQYQPQIQAEHNKFRPYAEAALIDLQEYLGFTELPFDGTKGKMITAYSPLMSHYQAFTVTVNNDVYIVSGPLINDPDESSYYHEAAHHFTDPIVDKNAEILEKVAPLVQMVEENDDFLAYGIVEESLVRALQILLNGQLFDISEEKIIEGAQSEYRFGFVLCPYFVENLPKYAATGKHLEEYFPELIAGIDMEHEIEKLNAFIEESGF